MVRQYNNISPASVCGLYRERVTCGYVPEKWTENSTWDKRTEIYMTM